ncbi:MAG: apolipoprotein N-acyltransferase, partial [Psychrosphaera sp.]|nr:apolipoprotein N-acyltransferase [Psychrosphaera sp.]
GLPLIASLAMIAMLVAYLSIYPALACAALTRFTPKSSYWIFAFAPLWLIFEWLRSVVLTGFPWLSLGYSQFESPMSAFAPVIGEIGITFVMCLTAVLLKQLVQRNNLKLTLSGLGVIILATVLLQFPQWTERQNTIKTIALVQGNIEQEMRYVPENDWPTFLKYLDLSRPYYSDVDLVIWPEAAIPMIELSAIDDLYNLDKAVANNKTALISGILDYNVDSKAIYNTLIVMGLREENDTKGQYHYPHNNRYNKHHLLPIGEFVPLEDFLRPLAPIFDLPMSSFTRGDVRQTNLRANGLNIVPAICYEIIFPGLLRQNITKESDFILTVSNDAWFGTSAGPLQHMQIAQMRALEFGLPLLRATNNGVTAITDEKGQIIKQLEQFETGVLTAKVNLVDGQTPYLLYGNWPVWWLSLFGLGFVFWRQRRA